MDLNSAGAAIIGAVVATFGVFIVELWLKPEFARKRVATILLVELRLNAKSINAVLKHREVNPESVSDSIVTSQRYWIAAANDIHHLPEPALRPLLLVYNQFAELDHLVAGYSRKTDLVLQIGDGPAGRALWKELQDESVLLGEMLPKILLQIDRTIPHLQSLVDVGPPGSIRGA